jgi:hypothetical protein
MEEGARSEFPIPFHKSFMDLKNGSKLDAGALNGERCKLFKLDEEYFVIFSQTHSIPYVSGQEYSHRDRARVELYFELAFGLINTIERSFEARR